MGSARFLPMVGIGALMVAGSAHSAAAYTEGWTVDGTGTDVVAADCGDCEEELGMVVACVDNGQPARITIHAGAAETGVDGGFAPIVFDIDGETIVRTAKTVHYGLLGYTPEIEIAYDDPLIPALQAGSVADVTFNDGGGQVSLKGSRDALAVFVHECGWTVEGFRKNLAATAANAPAPAPAPSVPAPAPQGQTAMLPVFGNQGSAPSPPPAPSPGPAPSASPGPSPTPAPAPMPASGPTPSPMPGPAPSPSPSPAPGPQAAPAPGQQAMLPVFNDQQAGTGQMPPQSQTVLTRTPPVPDADGMFWFTGDGAGGGSPKTIYYAIPQSDASALFASCEQFDPATLSLEVYTSFGNRGPGSAVTLEITHALGMATFQGSTFIENEEYAGSRFRVPKADPVWAALAQSPQFSIGIAGEQKAQLPGLAGAPALTEFSTVCRQ
ncbi:MAG: hypothetical protein JJ926_18050 [Roseitalea sp.]|nr:hypothetical protein [Roseitalea sp.]MBO6953784.1 hypothetical protein [Rhizobiaceae bacterium]MBO6594132.1 hypothetical protein [Roseitalea sp.]MBO6601435.1 hypothetical protein [Roseitalea sp.]MBO6613525.1 hypothetical protein [Roseitalea sp.]